MALELPPVSAAYGCVRTLLPIALALLAACSGAAPQMQAPPSLAAPVAEGRHVEERSDLLHFIYAYPAQAAAIPALSARLEAELALKRREAAEMARDDRAGRPADAPFFGHSYEKSWTVAGDTARLLSLKADTSFFTGGAHPNFLYDAILWDRQQDRALAAADSFSEPARAFAAIERLYCPALDLQRLEKRGGAIMPPGAWETECPLIAKQAVVPADRDGNGRFERLLVMLPPYEAGPYAEGDYMVDVPLNDALIAEVRSDLRASFEAQEQ